MDSSGSEQGPVAGSCEYCNESSATAKDGNLLTSWLTVSFSRRTAQWGWLVGWLVS
jgi:hypothetical protein